MAVSWNCGMLTLQVLDWNSKARELYENLGARTIHSYVPVRFCRGEIDSLAKRRTANSLNWQFAFKVQIFETFDGLLLKFKSLKLDDLSSNLWSLEYKKYTLSRLQLTNKSLKFQVFEIWNTKVRTELVATNKHITIMKSVLTNMMASLSFCTRARLILAGRSARELRCISDMWGEIANEC